jgi:hypothetical protein
LSHPRCSPDLRRQRRAVGPSKPEAPPRIPYPGASFLRPVEVCGNGPYPSPAGWRFNFSAVKLGGLARVLPAI